MGIIFVHFTGLGKCSVSVSSVSSDADGGCSSEDGADDEDVLKFNDAIPVFQFVTAKMDDVVK